MQAMKAKQVRQSLRLATVLQRCARMRTFPSDNTLSLQTRAMDVFGGSDAGSGAAAAAAGGAAAAAATSASALTSPSAAMRAGVTYKPASLPETHPCRELLLAATASVAPLLPASSVQARAQLQAATATYAASKESAVAATCHAPTIADRIQALSGVQPQAASRGAGVEAEPTMCAVCGDEAAAGLVYLGRTTTNNLPFISSSLHADAVHREQAGYMRDADREAFAAASGMPSRDGMSLADVRERTVPPAVCTAALARLLAHRNEAGGILPPAVAVDEHEGAHARDALNTLASTSADVGTSIVFCGHTAHYECMRSTITQMSSTRLTNARGLSNSSHVQFKLGEFLCPICQGLSNVMIPALANSRPGEALAMGDAVTAFTRAAENGWAPWQALRPTPRSPTEVAALVHGIMSSTLATNAYRASPLTAELGLHLQLASGAPIGDGLPACGADAELTACIANASLQSALAGFAPLGAAALASERFVATDGTAASDAAADASALSDGSQQGMLNVAADLAFQRQRYLYGAGAGAGVSDATATKRHYRLWLLYGNVVRTLLHSLQLTQWPVYGSAGDAKPLESMTTHLHRNWSAIRSVLVLLQHVAHAFRPAFYMQYSRLAAAAGESSARRRSDGDAWTAFKLDAGAACAGHPHFFSSLNAVKYWEAAPRQPLASLSHDADGKSCASDFSSAHGSVSMHSAERGGDGEEEEVESSAGSMHDDDNSDGYASFESEEEGHEGEGAHRLNHAAAAEADMLLDELMQQMIANGQEPIPPEQRELLRVMFARRHVLMHGQGADRDGGDEDDDDEEDDELGVLIDDAHEAAPHSGGGAAAAADAATAVHAKELTAASDADARALAGALAESANGGWTAAALRHCVVALTAALDASAPSSKGTAALADDILVEHCSAEIVWLASLPASLTPSNVHTALPLPERLFERAPEVQRQLEAAARAGDGCPPSLSPLLAAMHRLLTCGYGSVGNGDIPFDLAALLVSGSASTTAASEYCVPWAEEYTGPSEWNAPQYRSYDAAHIALRADRSEEERARGSLPCALLLLLEVNPYVLLTIGTSLSATADHALAYATLAYLLLLTQYACDAHMSDNAVATSALHAEKVRAFLSFAARLLQLFGHSDVPTTTVSTMASAFAERLAHIAAQLHIIHRLTGSSEASVADMHDTEAAPVPVSELAKPWWSRAFLILARQARTIATLRTREVHATLSIDTFSQALLRVHEHALAPPASSAGGVTTALRPVGLIPLPHEFAELYSRVRGQSCTHCGKPPSQPALCLLCGSLLCAHTACCEVNREAECTRHTRTCHGSDGIFLVLPWASVIMIHDGYADTFPSIYVDAHGDEDERMKRGKPLFLSRERYAHLTEVWASYAVSREISDRRTVNTRLYIHNAL